MKDCPCNGCGKRSAEPNCHGYCREYRDWRAALWAEKDAAQAGRDADAHTRQVICRNLRRANGKKQVGQR